MGTTAEKLYRILDSKRAIKEALEAKGVVITDETTFAEYAELINEIVQGAISDADALTFIMDVAEGKRKIANAVKNKYEGTKGEASEVTEYSTFDELSNKISQIPIEVPMGSAMEQNGGVLPFFDVYNETLKAMASVGTEYNGCCAFELDKLSYDNDHKVTLLGADAYYTSDGTFIKDGIISKNGSQIGELDNSLYQFQDREKENTNRFVVYFFVNERYEVPKSLPATSCLNLWCVKGTPLMNFNGDFTALKSIYTYSGCLEATSISDILIKNIYTYRNILSHIVSIKGVSSVFYGSGITTLDLPNLTTISEGTYIVDKMTSLKILNLPNLAEIKGDYIITGNNSLKELEIPKLTTITKSGYTISVNTKLEYLSLPNLTTISDVYLMLSDNSNLKKVTFPKLKKAKMVTNTLINTNHSLTEISLPSLEEIEGQALLSQNDSLLYVEMPKLHKSNGIFGYIPKCQTLKIGNGMRDGVAGDIKIYTGTYTYLTTLTVAEGFKAKLNLTGCNGLERDVLLGIINNLADLKGTEYEDKLQLTLGSTLYGRLNDDDIKIGTDKGWKVTG